MWNLIQACWKTEPTERPDMFQVVTHFTSDPSWQKSLIKPDFFDPLSNRRIPSSDFKYKSKLGGHLPHSNNFGRVPALTQAERELLLHHRGCFKCRRFYVGHHFSKCTNGYPSAVGYQVLTEAAALDAQSRVVHTVGSSYIPKST